MALKILLVEDNLDIREITSQLLGGLGYAVTAAENGQEGVELFKKQRFDLIITDIFMPVMDGNQFIALLATYSEPPPIIALSYDAFDISPNPVITAVATKPLTSQKLNQLISSALNTPLHLPSRQRVLAS